MIKGITKSKNLFDINRTRSDTFTLDASKWFVGAATTSTASPNANCTVSNGKISVKSLTAGYGACFMVPVMGQTAYTLSFDANKVSSGSYFGYSYRDAEGNILYQSTSSAKSTVLATYDGTAFLDICFRLPPADGEVTYSNIMLNSGSQPLPYEPYGDVPKDITRIAMKGKQLWDGSIRSIDVGMTGSRYGFTISGAGTYTVSIEGSVETGDYCYLRILSDGTYSDSEYLTTGTQRNKITKTILEGEAMIVFNASGSQTLDQSQAKFARWKVMVSEGDERIPYEPYGMQPGWEVRDQQGNILWGADKTLTGTDSIQFKGYGLPLTDYKVEADMTVPATQEYSIEGTSSIDYQSDGTALTDLEFQGNMAQSGTPSSSSPIYPSEMGERTGNLFDKSTFVFGTDSNMVYTPIYVGDGTFTLSTTFPDNETKDVFILSGNVSSGASSATNGVDVHRARSVSSLGGYITIATRYNPVRQNPADYTYMLNLGQTALPYEPYGYKIPFSNGQTSYNVYLTEPLRKIGDYPDKAGMILGGKRNVKKLVFDGTENWKKYTQSSDTLYYLVLGDSAGAITATCSHCVYSDTVPASTTPGVRISNSMASLLLNLGNAIGSNTETDFKSYLAQQYQNGTPVTVWYVLATETTEPVTFPTVTPTQGANTLSVSTTLAPSKTRLTATFGVWPKNPIWPAEFGERTAQLIPEIVQGGVASDTGALTTSSIRVRTNILSITGGETYTVHAGNIYVSTIVFYADGVRVSNQSYSQDKKQKSFTVPSNANQIAIGFKKPDGAGDVTPDEAGNIMLNTGSTALPYEPYGKFKIPITCGGNTYNVFTTAPLRKIGSYADYEQLSVGEGRKIKKLVLDGTESYSDYAYSNTNGVSVRDVLDTTYNRAEGICNIYPVKTASGTTHCLWIGSGSGAKHLYFVSILDDMQLQDAAAFKTWVAQQYAAGTPVTVWYVLATPTTEQVTLPTITPTDGNDAFAVNTTVPPSAVTIKGHIKELT